ncbi:MAG: nucleotidyltransferase domain-containing protein [Nanoarchaeota archaeon]
MVKSLKKESGSFKKKIMDALDEKPKTNKEIKKQTEGKNRPTAKHDHKTINHKHHENSNLINAAHKTVEHKKHEEQKAKEPEHHQTSQHHKKNEEHHKNNSISTIHHDRPAHQAKHRKIHHIKHHKHHTTHHTKTHVSHSETTHQSPKLSTTFRTDKDVAMDFATKVHRLFDHLIKATVLFGSQATGDQKPGSDIDMIIIIDDAAINWDLELTAWYREELAKLIASQNYGKDLHINTIRLTTWWRDLLHGDPVVLNIIRNGQVLIDIGGFFNPIKALMIQGKIHSTPEAVYAALQRSPHHLVRSKLALLSSVEGVYWCMVEAAQAALITLGKLPPSPEHVTKMLNESFVETGIMKQDYVKWYRDIYILHKQIAHGEIKSVKAAEIEAWQDRAEDFMKKMVDIIDKLIEARKNAVQKE